MYKVSIKYSNRYQYFIIYNNHPGDFFFFYSKKIKLYNMLHHIKSSNTITNELILKIKIVIKLLSIKLKYIMKAIPLFQNRLRAAIDFNDVRAQTPVRQLAYYIKGTDGIELTSQLLECRNLLSSRQVI